MKYTKVVAVYLNQAIIDELELYAAKLGMKVSPLIRHLILEKLEHFRKMYGEVLPQSVPDDEVTFAPHNAAPAAPTTPTALFDKPEPHIETVTSSRNDERASEAFQDKVEVDTSRGMDRPIAGGLRW